MTTQDVFPATVAIAAADFPVDIGDMRSSPATEGSARVTPARVVIGNGLIIIAKDGPQGPEVVFREKIAPETHYKSPSPSTKDSYIQTVSGKKIVFRKDSTCGCGSRLRTWRPFNSLTSIADPTE